MSKKDNETLTSSFLGAQMRIDLIEKLKGWGIDAKDLSDTEILDKVTNYAADMNKKLVASQVEPLTQQINAYAAVNPVITDKEFVMRLFNLNMPKRYLKLFTNADGIKLAERDWRKDSAGKKLPDGEWAKTDKMIWNKVRKSRIKPMAVEEIFKARYKEQDIYGDKPDDADDY